MAGNTVTIQINTDGTAAITGVEKINDSMKKMEIESVGVLNKVGGAWTALKGVWVEALAAYMALSETKHLMEVSAQYQAQSEALNRLAGQYNMTADTMISAIQRAADGTISKVNAITVANKGLMMGLDPQQLTKFTAIAKGVADALGGDIAQAFETLNRAAATGNARLLKRVGILVDLKGAAKEYAHSMGMMTDELTNEERQLAGANAILKKSDEIMKFLGNSHDTARDKIERFNATIEDMKLIIGDGLNVIKAFVIGGLMILSGGVALLIAQLTEATIHLVELGEKLPLVGDKFKAVGDELRGFAAHERAVAEEARKMAQSSIDAGVVFLKQQEINTAQAKEDAENKKKLSEHALDQRLKALDAEAQYKLKLYELSEAAFKRSTEVELATLDARYKGGSALTAEYFKKKLALENMAFTASAQTLQAERAAVERSFNDRIALLRKSGERGEQIQAARYEQKTKLMEIDDKIAAVDDERAKNTIKNLDEMRVAERALADEKIRIRLETEKLDARPSNLSGLPPALSQFVTEHQQLVDMKRQFAAEEAAIDEKTNGDEMALGAFRNAAIKKMDAQAQQEKLAGASSAASALGTIAGNLNTIMGGKSKEMFYLQKAMAIASILIDTEMGAIKAIGMLGPFGIPLAAMIHAIGWTSAAAVAATTFMGTGSPSSGGGGAMPTYNATPSGGYPAPSSSSQDSTQPGQNITLQVYSLDPSSVNWDKLMADNIAPALEKLSGDGNKPLNLKIATA